LTEHILIGIIVEILQRRGEELKKINCWQFKHCGREPGGKKVGEMGICSASSDRTLHGIHGGDCSGRACWIVAGTFCGGKEQGTLAQKYHNCEICDFYLSVRKEEGLQFKMSTLLLAKMRA
jgi:hypothetical protein